MASILYFYLLLYLITNYNLANFEQVYNWTDSPSILSNDTLLILDPHHSWTQGFNPPGGPEYSFVKDAHYPAMKNQMEAFSTIIKDFSTPYPGTVVRIPLRTPAEHSEISDRVTTTSTSLI